MESIESKIINDWLKEQAKNPAGKPIFRVVWAEEQFELRSGTFCLWDNDKLIREVSGTKRVPKYPDIRERWILEGWFPPELVAHNDLPDISKGSYECLYVFETKKGDPLPLKLEPVQFFVHMMLKPKSSSMLIKSTIEEDLEQKERAQYIADMEYLDVSTDIQSNLHFGEGIIVPANYEVESPNLRNK